MGKKNRQKYHVVDNKKDFEKTNQYSDNVESVLISEDARNDMEKKPEKRKFEEHDNKYDELNNDKKPKKKKKKASPFISESSEKKNKKSIRQMKKEKHAQRQAAAEVMAKDQIKSQCLNYLSQWKHNRQHWKFMKAKQVWLYKNKFSSLLIPDSSWPILLEYFESAKGNIKSMLLMDANTIIKQMDEWTESRNNDEQQIENKTADSENAIVIQKPDDTVYNRARSLIQCLEE